jgi:hypothetical protein
MFFQNATSAFTYSEYHASTVTFKLVHVSSSWFSLSCSRDLTFSPSLFRNRPISTNVVDESHTTMKISSLLTQIAGSVNLLAGLTASFTGHSIPGWIQRSTVEPLRATVYYPSSLTGNVDVVTTVFEESYFEARPNEDLAKAIQESSVPALARLASAFSPPGHAIALRDIAQVDIMGIDGNRIHLETVICEKDGCVTLAVPITFPNPCGDAYDLEACILDNIGVLDHKASEVLGRILWEETNFEQIQASARQLEACQSTDGVQLPFWWVQPTSELLHECAFLRNVLNEEDLSNLVGRHGFVVEQAAVVAVGPAGLVLRAMYRRHEDDDSPRLQTIETPVKFQQVCVDVESLRDAVLGAVECSP